MELDLQQQQQDEAAAQAEPATNGAAPAGTPGSMIVFQNVTKIY